MRKIPINKQIVLSRALHLLLMMALIWLPIANLNADPHQAVEFSTVSALSAVVADEALQHSSYNYSAQNMGVHQSHQAGTQQQNLSSIHVDLTLTEVMHDSASDCGEHQSPCCNACLSFCGVSILSSVPVIFPRVERCRFFIDSLAGVVLPRNIRPPIV